MIPRGALQSWSRLNLPPLPRRLGGGEERGGERFVEGKVVFHPVPVAGERLGPVTAVHGAVQLLVGLEQRRGHRQRVVEIGQHLSRVFGPRVPHRLRRGLRESGRSIPKGLGRSARGWTAMGCGEGGPTPGNCARWGINPERVASNGRLGAQHGGLGGSQQQRIQPN